MSEIGIIRALEVADAPGQIRSLEVARGTPGASAYEIWRAQGNTGTEAQFLASLRGPVGLASTVPGPQGQSAYQVWLAAGNTGTQADFLNSLKGAPGTGGSTRPRGTGGTMFRAVTRTPGANTYTDLLPSSPAAAFDDALFRVLGVNNTIAAPGEDVEMTGSGLVAGKIYYVDNPTGTGPNMTAVPDNAPADFPTGNANIVNVNRRYREVGRTYADGNKLWLTVSLRLVELSEAPVPGWRLDLLTPPLNVRLEQPGTDQVFEKLWELGTVDPNSGARIVARASGLVDRPGTGLVSLQIVDFTQARMFYSPKTDVVTADGEILTVLESGNFDRIVGVAFRSAAAASNADRKGYFVGLDTTRVVLIGWPNATTTTLYSTTGLSHAVNTRYCLRVQYEGLNIRYKVWPYDATKAREAQGQNEPTVWTGEYTAASYTTAGRSGPMNEGNVNTHYHAYKASPSFGITFAELFA